MNENDEWKSLEKKSQKELLEQVKYDLIHKVMIFKQAGVLYFCYEANSIVLS